MAFGLNTGWLTGLNWWKIGAIAVIAVSLFGAGFLIGGNREKVKCESKRAEDNAFIVKEIGKIVEAQNEKTAQRVEQALKDTQEGSQIRAELQQLRGNLYELLQKRPSNPACAPTPAELELYKEIAGKTRSTGT